MTGLDDDRELEDFLAKRSSLHQRLADRDRTETPPPELDRLVMSKAREAIEVPAPVPVYRAPRWALPVTLAATVLLSFAVVLNLGRIQPKGVQSLRPASSEIQARQMAQPTEAAKQPVLETAPQVANSAAELKREGAEADQALLAKAENERAAGASAALARAEAVAPAGPAPPAMARAKTAADSSAVTDAQRAAEPAQSTLSEEAGAILARRDRALAADDKPNRTDPRAWLQEIERLRAAGKTEEADRELASFRRAFPGHAAPTATMARPPTQ